MMVNNSTYINKTNSYLLPQIIELKIYTTWGIINTMVRDRYNTCGGLNRLTAQFTTNTRSKTFTCYLFHVCSNDSLQRIT